MKQILLPLLISTVIVVVIFLVFGDLEIYILEFTDNARENRQEYCWISSLFLSTDILLPVPSSIIMYTNGLVLGTFYGTLLSLAGSLVSSTIGYGLGRMSAKIIKPETQKNAGHILQKYGGAGLLITRGIPILSESVSYTAGYMHMNFRYFFLMNAAGYLPVALLYAYFGSLGSDMNVFLYCFGASLLLSLLLFLCFRKTLIRNA